MSKLYLIPTPLGNLEDITLRAIRVLKEADVILAEDSRKSSILLKHLNIKKPVKSYHKFNEHKIVYNLINNIEQGVTTALVSDAGTPGISDPGFLLIREALKNQIEVECLPGPTALIPALVNSGLPSERFCFEGFIPAKKGRQKKLKSLIDQERTMIFYESPYRLIKTLHDFMEIFGPGRNGSVSRELTKIHEETIRGTVEEIARYFDKKQVKGEIVIVVEGKKVL